MCKHKKEKKRFYLPADFHRNMYLYTKLNISNKLNRNIIATLSRLFRTEGWFKI